MSNGCVFGSGICRWVGSELVNDQIAPVSCGLCESLCCDVDVAFLTWVFPPQELAIPNLPGHHACMRVEACGSVLFSLPQHAHDLVRGIKMRDLVKGTRFHALLFLLAIRFLNELN